MSGAQNAWSWDWYQATIRTPSADVQAGLLERFAGSWLEPESVRLGYGEAFAVRDDQGRRAALQAGGPNVWPNVVGSGQSAPDLAGWLRQEFALHEVTRCDAAADFDDPAAWDVLTGLALQLADERGLKVSHEGDWHRAVDGRTLYVGSRKSAFFVRIYEKQKEMAARGDPAADLLPPWLTRVESVVRPKDGARAELATLEPVDTWSFAAWGRVFLERVDGTALPTRSVREVRQSNDDRALEWMARQYGAMLARQASRDGMSWELLGARLARLHGRNEQRKEER